MVLCVGIILILFFLFIMALKSSSWSYMETSSFECGYYSYFFSRNSFSIHYFIMGIIFFFLDLELCIFMPLVLEEMSSILILLYSWGFILFLLLGLLLEWAEGKLEWKN